MEKTTETGLVVGKLNATTLFSHQKWVLERLFQLDLHRCNQWPYGKNAMVVLPTGSGKTLIAAGFAANYLCRLKTLDKLVVMIVPTQPLAEQQAASLASSLDHIQVQCLHGGVSIGNDESFANNSNRFRQLFKRLGKAKEYILRCLYKENTEHLVEKLDNEAIIGPKLPEYGETTGSRPKHYYNLTEAQCEIVNSAMEMEYVDADGSWTIVELPRVFVLTAEMLLNQLRHGYLRYSQISMLILDEIHYCTKSHPYANLMNFFHTMCPIHERPRVLGLTASPCIDNESIRTMKVMNAALLKDQFLRLFQKFQQHVDLEFVSPPYSKTREIVPWAQTIRIYSEVANEEIAASWETLFRKGVLEPFWRILQSATMEELIQNASSYSIQVNQEVTDAFLALTANLEEDCDFFKLTKFWEQFTVLLREILKLSGTWALCVAIRIVLKTGVRPKSLRKIKTWIEYLFKHVTLQPVAADALGLLRTGLKNYLHLQNDIMTLYHFYADTFETLFGSWQEKHDLLNLDTCIEKDSLQSLLSRGTIDYRFNQLEQFFRRSYVIAEHVWKKKSVTEDGAITCPLCNAPLKNKSEVAFNAHLQTGACSIKGLIFCRSRFMCYLVNSFLKKRKLCISAMTVGSSATHGLGSFMSMKNIDISTALFRFAKDDPSDESRIDVIVCTSVLKEGIDVAACNFVVRFDPVIRAIDNIQCRGRARKSSAVYVHFVANEKEADTLDLWEAYDTILEYVSGNNLSSTAGLPIIQRAEDAKFMPLLVKETGAYIPFEMATSFLFSLYQRVDAFSGMVYQYGTPPLSTTSCFQFCDSSRLMQLTLPALADKETVYVKNSDTLSIQIPETCVSKKDIRSYTALSALKYFYERPDPVLDKYLRLIPLQSTRVIAEASSAAAKYNCVAPHFFPEIVGEYFSDAENTVLHPFFIYKIETTSSPLFLPAEPPSPEIPTVSEDSAPRTLPIALLFTSRIPYHWDSTFLQCSLYHSANNLSDSDVFLPSFFHLRYSKEIQLTHSQLHLIEKFFLQVSEQLLISNLLDIKEQTDGQKTILPFVAMDTGDPDFEYMEGVLRLLGIRAKETYTRIAELMSFKAYQMINLRAVNSPDNAEFNRIFGTHISKREQHGICVTQLLSKKPLKYHPSHRVFRVVDGKSGMLTLQPLIRKDSWSLAPTTRLTRSYIYRHGQQNMPADASIVFPISADIVLYFLSLHSLSWRLQSLFNVLEYRDSLLSGIRMRLQGFSTDLMGRAEALTAAVDIKSQLLQEALCFPSAAFSVQSLQYPITIKDAVLPKHHYERLEHLGDTVLKLVIRLYCFSVDTTRDVGVLSDNSARFESNEYLANKFIVKELMQYVTKNRYERSKQLQAMRLVHISMKEAANILEAIIGVVYLSNCNFEYCLTHSHYEEKIASIKEGAPPPFPLYPTKYIPSQCLTFWTSSLALDAAIAAVDLLLDLTTLPNIYKGIPQFADVLKESVELIGESSSQLVSNDAVAGLYNIHFENTHLLTCARTHRSASDLCNLESLEFIGDAVLGILVAHWLYANFPSADEGLLHILKASLVNNLFLAQCILEKIQAAQLSLTSVINFGKNDKIISEELLSFGIVQFSLIDAATVNSEDISMNNAVQRKYIADFYEAMLGAYFIDIFVVEKQINLQKVWLAFGNDFTRFYPSIREIVHAQSKA